MTKPQPAPAPPAQPQPPPEPQVPDHVIEHDRLWVAVIFAVILLLLLIFILQNGRTVDIAYFGAHGHLPLGAGRVALLTVLASVAHTGTAAGSSPAARPAPTRGGLPRRAFPANPRG